MGRSHYLGDADVLAAYLVGAGVGPKHAPLPPPGPLRPQPDPWSRLASAPAVRQMPAGFDAVAMAPARPSPPPLPPPPSQSMPPAAEPSVAPSVAQDLPPLSGALEAHHIAVELAASSEDSTLEARFATYVHWLIGSTGAMAAFIADTEGLAIESCRTPDVYIAASATLGSVQDSLRAFVPSPPAGSTTMEVDGNNILQLIWVDTEVDRLVIGLVLADALPSAARERARAVLHALLCTTRRKLDAQPAAH